MTTNKSSSIPIEGQVAAVLNARELAINIGSKNGVTVGMKFKVLAPNPTKIVDPVSHSFLGELDREKVRVEAIEIKELFSVCRTYKTWYVGGGPFSDMAANEDLFAKPREVVETLKADDSSRIPPLSAKESFVKIGDRVIELLVSD
jgi:hypothetical protein